MSIKSDRWIRRMAAAHGMIEPFSPEQIRVSGGHKIVSYGTSSYGYDVRCADEFKIFTNINSTIVDPKSFDEKSLRRFQRAGVHHSAEFVRVGEHRGVLSHSAQCTHRVPRKKHVC